MNLRQNYLLNPEPEQSVMDTETNNKNKKILIDQFVCKSLKKGDNKGSLILQSKMHDGQIIDPEAFYIRKLTVDKILNKNLMSGYELTSQIDKFFRNNYNREFFAQNSSFDEKALIHTKDHYAFTGYYEHKYQGNNLYDIIPLAKTYAGLKNINLYDSEKNIYSLSQENLSSKILSDEQINSLPSITRHDGLYDVDEASLLLQEFKHEQRIKNYLKVFRNTDGKEDLLNNPLFFEFAWHYKIGYSNKLFMLIPEHPKFKKNWMNKIDIDPDHLFQENIETSVNLIKKNVNTFKSFKTTALNIIFPIGSKTFEEIYPNCDKDQILKIFNKLKNDNEFIFKMKKFWEKQKLGEKKYDDIYDYKHDGPVCNYDQKISRLFHQTTDPKLKNKYSESFKSPRLKKNAKRLMLYHFKEYMDLRERNKIFEEEINELNKKDASRVTFYDCEIGFEKLYESSKLLSDDRKNLKDYHQYIKALEANPKLLLGE